MVVLWWVKTEADGWAGQLVNCLDNTNDSGVTIMFDRSRPTGL